MTIHELLQAAELTANDEIPIWDADGTGEPTKKITAQQLAAAVVALANLVTGVKGNAESSYRIGDVNLTAANIGAVAKSGDTMTGDLTVQKSGEVNIHAKNTTTGVDVALVSAASGNQGVWSFGYWNGSNYVNDEKYLIYRNTGGRVVFGDVLDILHGGTGKTTNWEGLAALSTPRVNTTWKDAPVGVSVFKYEGNISSFDVPDNSFVVVIKENNARGVAYAIKWSYPGTALWISYLHDDSRQNNWSGWKTIVGPNGAVPVTSGGTGATTAAEARTNLGITPANIGAAAAGTHRYAMYNNVRQLGLTSGSATIAGAWSAMADSSILIADAGNFANSEIPSVFGTVVFVRHNVGRCYIYFHGKKESDGNYRMFFESANPPTGVWRRIYDESTVVPVTAGGTGATGVTGSSAELTAGQNITNHVSTVRKWGKFGVFGLYFEVTAQIDGHATIFTATSAYKADGVYNGLVCDASGKCYPIYYTNSGILSTRVVMPAGYYYGNLSFCVL